MLRNPVNGKPIFICDLDDVINSLVERWLELYNEEYSDTIKICDIKGWDIGKYTKAGDKLYVLLGHPGLFRNLDIQPDCYDVLKWADQFFDIQIVSASTHMTYADKAEWILEKLPFIPISSFSSVKNKYLIGGSVILDDNPENIKYFDGEKIIYTKPWNEDVNGYTRADNWNQVKEILQEYLEVSALLDFYQRSR